MAVAEEWKVIPGSRRTFAAETAKQILNAGRQKDIDDAAGGGGRWMFGEDGGESQLRGALRRAAGGQRRRGSRRATRGEEREGIQDNPVSRERFLQAE